MLNHMEKIKVQGIHDALPLLGMNQLCKYKDNIDYTTANLIYDGINYYVCLTCFIDKDNTKKQKVLQWQHTTEAWWHIVVVAYETRRKSHEKNV